MSVKRLGNMKFEVRLLYLLVNIIVILFERLLIPSMMRVSLN